MVALFFGLLAVVVLIYLVQHPVFWYFAGAVAVLGVVVIMWSNAENQRREQKEAQEAKAKQEALERDVRDQVLREERERPFPIAPGTIAGETFLAWDDSSLPNLRPSGVGDTPGSRAVTKKTMELRAKAINAIRESRGISARVRVEEVPTDRPRARLGAFASVGSEYRRPDGWEMMDSIGGRTAHPIGRYRSYNACHDAMIDLQEQDDPYPKPGRRHLRDCRAYWNWREYRLINYDPSEPGKKP